MIYGVDVHPRYQSGLNIEQLRREGFDFMATKLCENVDSSFMSAGSRDWVRRGLACGLMCMGYHYLRAGNEDAQARMFAQCLRSLNISGMLDAEEGCGNIRNIRSFISSCIKYGANVPLMYLPKWYWQKIGSPSLSGLPLLWASHYVSQEGTASNIYHQVPSSWWNGYGGLEVAVLQFTDKATAAGRQVDANVFRGSREEFAHLLGGGVVDVPATKQGSSSRILDLEDVEMYVETDSSSLGDDKSSWPAKRVSYGFDPIGGWSGNIVLKLHWGAPGGWIHEAKWWVRPGTGVGVPNQPHAPVSIDVSAVPERFVGLGWEITPPPCADELEIVFSAPGGCHIFVATEK